MAGKTFSIEDVIADEVKKAVSSQGATAMSAVTPAPAPVPAGGDLLGGLDIKSITGLLQEVNKLLQARNSAPAPVDCAPAPAGLPGVDNTPAFNPVPGAPAPADCAPAPAGIEPEKVYDLVLSSIGQIKTAIGDATLSEVAEFMEGNRAVVVALIGQEIEKL